MFIYGNTRNEKGKRSCWEKNGWNNERSWENKKGRLWHE